jgi:cyclic pyranopterin phosphate synthase
LLRGFNEDQIEAFGRFACEEQVAVRFIEFMPLDEGRAWSPEVVIPLAEILERMARFAPFHEIAHEPSSTSRRYRFNNGGEFGVIAPVTLPFCGACSRIRLTSDGKIRTCLFSLREHDLHAAIRQGLPDEELVRIIEHAVAHKEARHHIGEPGFIQPGRTMVHIGG